MSTLGRLKHLENTFKILIMGDASVGKTSILTRYADSHFGKFCHMITNFYILISYLWKKISFESWEKKLHSIEVKKPQTLPWKFKYKSEIGKKKNI